MSAEEVVAAAAEAGLEEAPQARPAPESEAQSSSPGPSSPAPPGGEPLAAPISLEPLKPVPKPNSEAYEKRLKELTDQLGHLDKRLESIRVARDSKREAQRKAQAEVDEARTLLTSIKAEQDQVKAQKEALMEERDTLTGRTKADRERVGAAGSGSAGASGADRRGAGGKGRAGPFLRPDQIIAEMEELEARQAHTSLSLSEEKALVNRLRDLRAMMSASSAAEEARVKAKADREAAAEAAKAARATNKERVAALNERISTVVAELKNVRDRQQAQWEILRTLSVTRDQNRSAIPELSTQFDTIREEKSKLHDELRQFKQSFYEQKKAYNAYTFAKRQQRDLQRKLEREQQAAAADGTAEGEDDSDAEPLPPWAEQIGICHALIAHLERSRPKTATGAGEGASLAAEVSLDGMKMSGKRGTDDNLDEFSFLMGGGAGKKKGKKGKAGGNSRRETIVHSTSTLQSFDLVGVAPPHSLTDTDDTITALRAKIQFYETAPPPDPESQSSPSKAAESKRVESKSPAREAFRQPAPESSPASGDAAGVPVPVVPAAARGAWAAAVSGSSM